MERRAGRRRDSVDVTLNPLTMARVSRSLTINWCAAEERVVDERENAKSGFVRLGECGNIDLMLELDK